MEGTKCSTMSIPMSCVPEINGAKNPHTGQVALRKTRADVRPTAAMDGRILGQYTLQADESASPLTRGKYTVKYKIIPRTATAPATDIRNRVRLASWLLHSVLKKDVARATMTANTTQATVHNHIQYTKS
jgi:hypothetical protein